MASPAFSVRSSTPSRLGCPSWNFLGGSVSARSSLFAWRFFSVHPRRGRSHLELPRLTEELGAHGFAPEHRAMIRNDARAKLAGINLRELGAEKQNTGRIVNPKQHNDYRCGRTVGRTDTASAEIEADEKFAEHKKQRGDSCANPHVTPADSDIRKNLENHGEEHRDNGQKTKKIQRPPYKYWQRQQPIHVFGESGENSAEQQENQKREPPDR